MGIDIISSLDKKSLFDGSKGLITVIFSVCSSFKSDIYVRTDVDRKSTANFTKL